MLPDYTEAMIRKAYMDDEFDEAKALDILSQILELQWFSIFKTLLVIDSVY